MKMYPPDLERIVNMVGAGLAAAFALALIRKLIFGH